MPLLSYFALNNAANILIRDRSGLQGAPHSMVTLRDVFLWKLIDLQVFDQGTSGSGNKLRTVQCKSAYTHSCFSSKEHYSSWSKSPNQHYWSLFPASDASTWWNPTTAPFFSSVRSNGKETTCRALPLNHQPQSRFYNAVTDALMSKDRDRISWIAWWGLYIQQNIHREPQWSLSSQDVFTNSISVLVVWGILMQTFVKKPVDLFTAHENYT